MWTTSFGIVLHHGGVCNFWSREDFVQRVRQIGSTKFGTMWLPFEESREVIAKFLYGARGDREADNLRESQANRSGRLHRAL